MERKIIVLIDDDCDDIEFFTDAMVSTFNDILLQCIESGHEAMQFLSEMKVAPSLILLDAGMPKMNGWECLKLIRDNKRFSHIPVIMIATSSLRKGIDEAGELGAAAYIVKPSDFDHLRNILQDICSSLLVNKLDEGLDRLQVLAPENIFLFREVN